MAKYYCILFDADNTLLNFDAAESKALAETLVEYGIEPDAETVQTYRTINEELWRQLEKGQIRRDKLMGERFTRFLKAINAAGDGVEMNRCYLERLSTHPDLMTSNVLDVLGAVDNSVFRDLFHAIRENRTKDCILKLEEMVVQGRELSQFVVDFIWFLRNLLLLKTADDAEDLLDMSEDNLAQMREDAALVDENTLMRYIRVFSELSNQIRFANQKRVLIELAFIKLTKPEMEQNMDSILERLEKLERMVEEGIPAMPAGGYVPAQNAGIAGDPMMGAAQISPQMYAQPAYDGAGAPGNGAGLAGQPAQNPAGMQNPPASGQTYEPRTVSLPKAQLEDLNMIRNEWGKIVRDMGMSIRPSFRETVVEPAGDSCLCIVFNDPMNFAIGSRPSVLGDLERYVEQKYGKSLYFKSRMRENGERMDTRYISDDELRENIHMDITIED